MLKSLKFVSRSAALNWRDCPNLGTATAPDVEAMFDDIWNGELGAATQAFNF